MIEWRLFIPALAFLATIQRVTMTCEIPRKFEGYVPHGFGECLCCPMAKLTHHVKHMAN